MSPILQSNLPGLALGTYSAANPASSSPLVGDNAGYWGPWLAGVRYAVGSQVLNAFDGGQYVALTETLGVRPDTSPSSWLPVTPTGAPTGAWIALAPLLNANLEASTTEERLAPAYRLENSGTLLRLRGLLKVITAEIAGAATLFTLPVGFRPVSKVDLIAEATHSAPPNVWSMEVFPTGVCRCFQALPVTSLLYLDTMGDFPLT